MSLQKFGRVPAMLQKELRQSPGHVSKIYILHCNIAGTLSDFPMSIANVTFDKSPDSAVESRHIPYIPETVTRV